MTKLLSRSALLAGLAVAGVAAFELQAPTQAREADALKYVGVLHGANGEAVSGQHAIGIEVWDDAHAGRRLCLITPQPVEVNDGQFSLVLSSECLGAVQHGTGLWTEIRIDGEHLLPRAALGNAPSTPASETKPAPAAPKTQPTPVERTHDKPAESPRRAPSQAPAPSKPADAAPTSVLLI